MKMPNAISAASEAVVTLTGATIADTTGNPGPAIARVEFRPAGTVFQTISALTTQISAATDWIFPRVGDLFNYEIRAGQTSGNPLDGTVMYWTPGYR